MLKSLTLFTKLQSGKSIVSGRRLAWIESARVGLDSLAYRTQPGSDFQGDQIGCDTGSEIMKLKVSRRHMQSFGRKGLKCHVSFFSEHLNSYSSKGLPGPRLGYTTAFRIIYSLKAYHEGSMGEKWKAFFELDVKGQPSCCFTSTVQL